MPLKMCNIPAVTTLGEQAATASRQVNDFMLQWSQQHGAMSLDWLDAPGMEFTGIGRAWTMVSDGLREMSAATGVATVDAAGANGETVRRCAAMWGTGGSGGPG